MEKTKILVVEDEVIIAMEHQSILERLGYSVISVTDTGEKAIIKAVEKNRNLAAKLGDKIKTYPKGD